MRIGTFKLLAAVPKPLGNPFMVVSTYDVTVPAMQGRLVDTGLELVIPEGTMVVAVQSLVDGVAVSAVPSNRLAIQVWSLHGTVTIKSFDPVAVVEIIERKRVPVRFMEVSNESGGKATVAKP